MSGPLTRQHGFCISSTGALLSVNADMPVADALEQASNLLVCVDTLAGIAAHGGQANELFAIQYLAEMAGTTLYTVSRVLSQWEQAGLVESGRERVLIRSPHALVSIAEDLPTPST